MKRKDLIDALDRVSPALAPESESIAAVFGSFNFTEKSLIAFNDIIAIRVKNPNPEFTGVIPGRLSLKFLKACSGEEADFIDLDKDGKWQLKSKSAKLEFVRQASAKFPFKFPKVDGTPMIELTPSFFEALSVCISIVTDKGMSTWTSGVLFNFGKKLTIGSSSSTRDHLLTYEVKGDFPSDDSLQQVVLPISFCKVILDLHKSYPKRKPTLHFFQKKVVVKFGPYASVFSRVIIPENDLDFLGKLNSFLKSSGDLVDLTESVKDIFRRVASVASTTDTCQIKVSDGKLIVRMMTKGGVVKEIVKMKSDHADVDVITDPSKIVKHLDRCDRFVIAERMIVFSGKSFKKLVGNRVDTKES